MSRPRDERTRWNRHLFFCHQLHRCNACVCFQKKLSWVYTLESRAAQVGKKEATKQCAQNAKQINTKHTCIKLYFGILLSVDVHLASFFTHNSLKIGRAWPVRMKIFVYWKLNIEVEHNYYNLSILGDYNIQSILSQLGSLCLWMLNYVPEVIFCFVDIHRHY